MGREGVWRGQRHQQPPSVDAADSSPVLVLLCVARWWVVVSRVQIQSIDSIDRSIDGPWCWPQGAQPASGCVGISHSTASRIAFVGGTLLRIYVEGPSSAAPRLFLFHGARTRRVDRRTTAAHSLRSAVSRGARRSIPPKPGRPAFDSNADGSIDSIEKKGRGLNQSQRVQKKDGDRLHAKWPLRAAPVRSSNETETKFKLNSNAQPKSSSSNPHIRHGSIFFPSFSLFLKRVLLSLARAALKPKSLARRPPPLSIILAASHSHSPSPRVYYRPPPPPPSKGALLHTRPAGRRPPQPLGSTYTSTCCMFRCTADLAYSRVCSLGLKTTHHQRPPPPPLPPLPLAFFLPSIKKASSFPHNKQKRTKSNHNTINPTPP